MNAKEAIFARIAAAQVPALAAERPAIKPSCRDREEIVGQFIEHAAEYRANVLRVTPERASETLEALLGGRTLVSEDWKAAWGALYSQSLSPAIAQGLVPDRGLSVAELDAADAALTLCAVAIAETGTVVLDHGPGQGRRAMTLIPDRHVVVVPADRIVDSVPEAVAALAEGVRAGRPLTWISGPSATSDIELTRVEGVHGPRRLDLLVVG